VSELISVIEMVNVGGVKIDGLLHEAKPKHSRVKIHIRLRVARKSCDVMYPLYDDGHGSEIDCWNNQLGSGERTRLTGLPFHGQRRTSSPPEKHPFREGLTTVSSLRLISYPGTSSYS
jgi:hypothetical protein